MLSFRKQYYPCCAAAEDKRLIIYEAYVKKAHDI